MDHITIKIPVNSMNNLLLQEKLQELMDAYVDPLTVIKKLEEIKTQGDEGK